MKRLLTQASFALGMMMIMAKRTLAQSGFFDNPQGGTGTINVTTTQPLGTAAASVVNWALGILGLVTVIVIIYAGVNMVIARGDEGKIETSKKTITWAVIGLLIIIFAWTIVQFVLGALVN